ncbi:hypothetical protein [Microcoleus sp. herbarium12]|jgi:hypothetical protein|uniref:hypothetical protein n=1 Tax=Microcoleus sp. herbarium12 TaxID=3055437 RepID=UPI002FD6E558
MNSLILIDPALAGGLSTNSFWQKKLGCEGLCACGRILAIGGWVGNWKAIGRIVA